jgi:hypothetical protein
MVSTRQRLIHDLIRKGFAKPFAALRRRRLPVTDDVKSVIVGRQLKSVVVGRQLHLAVKSNGAKRYPEVLIKHEHQCTEP